jgi:hypothetical protein
MLMSAAQTHARLAGYAAVQGPGEKREQAIRGDGRNTLSANTLAATMDEA